MSQQPHPFSVAKHAIWGLVVVIIVLIAYLAGAPS